ncbi:MAG: pentapeptide repeat-containing protein [Candidatus Eisenbacteria bacterium]
MPLVRESDWIHLLRDGQFTTFNQRAEKTPPDLVDADLRLCDLRQADLRHANMTGAYLRNADLRGVDLSEAQLEGASIHAAKISGTYFPPSLSPEEIRLSAEVGTRMRVRAA